MKTCSPTNERTNPSLPSVVVWIWTGDFFPFCPSLRCELRPIASIDRSISGRERERRDNVDGHFSSLCLSMPNITRRSSSADQPRRRRSTSLPITTMPRGERDDSDCSLSLCLNGIVLFVIRTDASDRRDEGEGEGEGEQSMGQTNESRTNLFSRRCSSLSHSTPSNSIHFSWNMSTIKREGSGNQLYHRRCFRGESVPLIFFPFSSLRSNDSFRFEYGEAWQSTATTCTAERSSYGRISFHGQSKNRLRECSGGRRRRTSVGDHEMDDNTSEVFPAATRLIIHLSSSAGDDARMIDGDREHRQTSSMISP